MIAQAEDLLRELLTALEPKTARSKDAMQRETKLAGDNERRGHRFSQEWPGLEPETGSPKTPAAEGWPAGLQVYKNTIHAKDATPACFLLFLAQCSRSW